MGCLFAAIGTSLIAAAALVAFTCGADETAAVGAAVFMVGGFVLIGIAAILHEMGSWRRI